MYFASVQFGSVVRVARSTGYDPNLFQNESGPKCLSSADGDDQDLMRKENSQVLKIMFFKWHGETQVQFTEPRGT